MTVHDITQGFCFSRKTLSTRETRRMVLVLAKFQFRFRLLGR